MHVEGMVTVPDEETAVVVVTTPLVSVVVTTPLVSVVVTTPLVSEVVDSSLLVGNPPDVVELGNSEVGNPEVVVSTPLDVNSPLVVLTGISVVDISPLLVGTSVVELMHSEVVVPSRRPRIRSLCTSACLARMFRCCRCFAVARENSSGSSAPNPSTAEDVGTSPEDETISENEIGTVDVGTGSVAVPVTVTGGGTGCGTGKSSWFLITGSCFFGTK